MMDESALTSLQVGRSLLAVGVRWEIDIVVGNDSDLLQSSVFVRICLLSARRRLNDLIASRTAARARKDFKESADRIRDELAAMGVVIKRLPRKAPPGKIVR